MGGETKVVGLIIGAVVGVVGPRVIVNDMPGTVVKVLGLVGFLVGVPVTEGALEGLGVWGGCWGC